MLIVSLSVIGNVILNNEHHVDWMIDCIAFANKQDSDFIEATLKAQTGWMNHVAELAEKSLYMQANSWFFGANIPNKPKVFLPYVGAGYRKKCAEVANSGYQGFRFKD